MHYLHAELNEHCRTNDVIFDFLRESSLDGMWYWDLEDPEHEWMSPEFWRLFGYDPDDMPHKASAWQDIIHPDDLKTAISNFEKHLADPEHPYDQIVRYAHRETGDYVTVRCRGMAIRDESGNPIRMLGAHTDLTDLKRTEVALRQANHELACARNTSEAASRAKTMFLETMSHEIRTPMNGVVGMVEALLQTQLDQKQRQIASVISNSANSLLILLNDILDFSRIEAGTISMELAPFTPRDLISEVAALFDQSAIEKNIDLSLKLSAAMIHPRVGSARSVRQVLTNLVSNSVKFTPQGGKIDVTAGLETTDKDDKVLVLTVQDTGPGVPDDMREKIFGRFVQHDHQDGSMMKGTGLGLSIARKLCEFHGGSLSLVSGAEDAGAHFEARFKLAKHGRDACQQDHEEPVFNALPKRPLHLLIVEDNELNRLVMEAMLARDQITLDFAPNGKEALDLACAGSYDAALVDIRMPVMDGITFAERLRGYERENGRAQMLLIACSANVLPHQVESFYASGFARHLSKPVTLDALNQLLDWITDQSQSNVA